MAAQKKAEEEAAACLEKEAEKQKELLDMMMDEESNDKNKGKYVHAWVMIAGGSRDVSLLPLRAFQTHFQFQHHLHKGSIFILSLCSLSIVLPTLHYLETQQIPLFSIAGGAFDLCGALHWSNPCSGQVSL